VDPASGVINRFGYDKIEGVDTPDDLTVVVRFSQPFASWPTLFDALIPKRVVDANPTGLANAADILQPIGAGPYRIVQYKTGELVEYAAFDGYWRGKPKIQRLFIKFYPSVEGLMQAVTAKEVDIGWNLTANLISQIQALAPQGIKLVDSGIPSSEKYLMNPDASKAPLFAGPPACRGSPDDHRQDPLRAHPSGSRGLGRQSVGKHVPAGVRVRP
jgi:ABC-type transport system substrate-binding protein